MGVYHHIKAVVKNAVILAESYGADLEVVTIGAWLHDIASITDYNLYEEHHIHGARIAGDILSSFNYPEEKIELVKKCILNHRASKLIEKLLKRKNALQMQTPYPILITSSLFYLAYVVRKYSIDEGIDFVKKKLIRSYNKLSEDSKEVYREKYDTVMSILD